MTEPTTQELIDWLDEYARKQAVFAGDELGEDPLVASRIKMLRAIAERLLAMQWRPMSDYQELRDAIAAATPGPWNKGCDSHWGTEVRGPDNQTVAHCGGIADQARRNIAYLIAANPQTISDLLAAFDRAIEIAEKQ